MGSRSLQRSVKHSNRCRLQLENTRRVARLHIQEREKHGKDIQVSAFSYQLLLVGARRLESFEKTRYPTIPYHATKGSNMRYELRN